MKYFSVFSGIEAVTVAAHSLEWSAVGFSEIDPFACAVLKKRYPEVVNYGDITKLDGRCFNGKVDVLVGGSPCQSFSVAGKREGLGGASGLVREYFRLLREVKPTWFVWENVPGCLSSNRGRDYAFILREWEECGYHVAWRILDAQFFGVPQRRRRVFAVGHLGDWRAPIKVLFESESLCRDTSPRRKTRKEDSRVTGTLSANCGGLTRPAGTCNEIDFCVPINTQMALRGADTSNSTREGVGIGKNGDAGFTLQAAQCRAVAYIQQRIGEYKNCGIASTLSARDHKSATDLIAYSLAENTIGRRPENGGNGSGWLKDKVYTLNATGVHGIAAIGKDSYSDIFSAVRRLTPVECERLQGFPDNYTRISWKGKNEEACPDTPRYKALGNSMAVPVMKWLFERIDKVNNEINI